MNFYALAVNKTLNDLSRLRALPKNEAAYYASMVAEARASASHSIVENMNALEIFKAADASRVRQNLPHVVSARGSTNGAVGRET